MDIVIGFHGTGIGVYTADVERRAVGPGADARSRLITATEEGQRKRVEAQRKWRVAQERINQTLGARRVVALHTLIDEAMELLSPAEPGNDDA